jgi:aspartate/glutamate racemase
MITVTEKHDWTDSLNVDGFLPPEVRDCGEKLNSCGVWWRAAWNHERTPVFSCMQAVKYRERLGSGGNGGIPLWSELKSLVGIASDPTNGKRIGFAAHTRANTQFNHRSLLEVLGLQAENARIHMVFNEETAARETPGDDNEAIIKEKSGISNQEWFGIVNPFNVDRVLAEFTGGDVQLEDIPQVLDASLELDGGVPNTIMSNLGIRTVAFEIHPADLISAIRRLSPRSFVAPIAEPYPIWLGLAGKHLRDYWLQFPPARGPKIGILTGNSPESGMALWHDILEGLRGVYSYIPDVLMPEVHIHSVPEMGLSMELTSREEEVWQVVRKGVEGLLNVGCTIITFACNTTIYYEPQIADLCEARGARFVSIAEACMPAVRRALGQSTRGANVGLVGIGPVVDMEGGFSGYKRYLEAEGIQVIACPADQLAFKVKSKGTGDELITEFRQRMKTLPNESVVVILALTEASMVYRDHVAKASKKWTSNKIYIDPLLELGKYLSFLYLAQGYRKSRVSQIPDDFDVDAKLRRKFGWH